MSSPVLFVLFIWLLLFSFFFFSFAKISTPQTQYDTAVQDLKIFCDSGAVVAQKHVELFRRDDTVVYICNYRDWEVPCKSDEWELKNAAMDVECGAWNGAYSFGESFFFFLERITKY